MRCFPEHCDAESPLLWAVLSLPVCRSTKELQNNKCLKKLDSPASFVVTQGQGDLMVPRCPGCLECRKCRLQWPDLILTPPKPVDLKLLVSRGGTLDALESLTQVCLRHSGNHRVMPPKLLTPQQHLCSCFHTCQPTSHRCSRRRQRVLRRIAVQVAESYWSLGPHSFGYFMCCVFLLLPPTTRRSFTTGIAIIFGVVTTLALLHMIKKVKSLFFFTQLDFIKHPMSYDDDKYAKSMLLLPVIVLMSFTFLSSF